MIGDEEAKAIQELAQLGGKTLDTVHGVGRFAERILGPAADELGLYLGERVHAWRTANMRAALAGAEEIHRSRGVGDRVDPIPPRVGIAIIEGASKEDDPILQRTWAALLANAADPERRSQRDRTFALILAALEPLDVLVLYSESTRGLEGAGILNVEDLAKQLGNDVLSVVLSAENLTRQGCFGVDRVQEGLLWDAPVERRPRLKARFASYEVTDLGQALSRACHPS